MSSASLADSGVGSIECRAAALQQALTGTALAIARRPPLPILDHVLLELAGPTLTLTTTNLEVAVRWALPCAPPAPAVAGSVPFRPLQRWVQRRKPDERLTVTLTAAGPAVHLRVVGRGGHLDLPGAAAGFPTVPADPAPGETPVLLFGLAELQVGLPRVQYAAATSESPFPIFHSVGWHAAAGATTLQLGATDGYRGALLTLPLPAPLAGPAPLAHALPLPASAVLAKLLAQIPGPAAGPPASGTLYHRAQQPALFVLTPAVRLLVHFRPAPYPDLATQVPASWQTRATLDRASLQAAVATIQAALAGDLARLRIQALPTPDGPGGQVILTAWGTDRPGAVVTLDALVVGVGGEQALAPTYLAAALAAVPTAQVVLDLTLAGGPCLVRPVPERGATHLIMPMVL